MVVVSKVPIEILTEIFYLLCKKPISVYKLNNWCYKEGFPWAVGLVSRQWRAAFLSYPPIWASLTLSDMDGIDHDRSECYADERIRRLALYLERSGGYPLRLDICFWYIDKCFTMMALDMLILPGKGKLPILEWLEIRVLFLRKHDRGIFEVAPRLTHASIRRWAQGYNWILPWTQLTELVLTLDGVSVIKNGDVPNLLPMLHNIKELRIRFKNIYGEVDFDDDFPPTSLNQLHVLEVPHPAFLSWVEAPSLCEIYFVDHHRDYYGPLDVQGQIFSLIQRSSCRIRKLSFSSGRKFYVGMLEDMVELVIDCQHSHGFPSSIDISSLPASSHHHLLGRQKL
ncbi:hypothetical protein M378DRAFT_13577 [Amanita muscaria Koide BX008]|uniref:F-box domain-containing protein n=1 Tax=Amanita muscaria (strain Koide BX008) TaxID=946122 RepID=A0A0C2T4E4_AMAMK|nr:hypothetical protein M378DRAFT_13577 [Amanita muscaria Koide BX008]